VGLACRFPCQLRAGQERPPRRHIGRSRQRHGNWRDWTGLGHGEGEVALHGNSRRGGEFQVVSADASCPVNAVLE
jgi:hypothetical protein